MPLTHETREEILRLIRETNPEFQAVVNPETADDFRLIGAISAIQAALLISLQESEDLEKLLDRACTECPEVKENDALVYMLSDLGGIEPGPTEAQNP